MPFLGRAPDNANVGDDTITSAKIVNATIASADIADDAIIAAKIADDAVVAGAIADDAVITAKIADGSITAAKFAAGAIGTASVADNSITTAKIADDAVVQAGIADDAVNEARLQISNTPTNGYFLSAQSGNTGGLTWAESGGGAYSDWTILTTTPTTLAAKGQYVCNDTTARTHTLPSGSAGNTIIIANAGSATVTIARTSSQKINSAAEDGTLPQGNSVQLVYVDATIGWFEV